MPAAPAPRGRRGDRSLAPTDEGAIRIAGVDPATITIIPEAASPIFSAREGVAVGVQAGFGVEVAFLFYTGPLEARKGSRRLRRRAGCRTILIDRQYDEQRDPTPNDVVRECPEALPIVVEAGGGDPHQRAVSQGRADSSYGMCDDSR